MNDAIYERLAKVLDTLPNGFPATESGVEIKLLKKIFRPEQAELFCDLRLTFETTADIAKRTDRPLEGLEERLVRMGKQGQIFMIAMGEMRFFRMLPWVFGIYEFQLNRMDKEFAELCEIYRPAFGRQFFSQKPQLMQTLAIEEAIPVQQEALPYEKVSAIIENGQSFLANECICKKEKGLLGQPCEKPVEVCLAIAPVPGIFDNSPSGRVLTREEAYALLKETEEAGLVHLTANVQVGQIYICNCCGCCCGVLKAINDLGIPASQVINSHYYAEIDAEVCIGCGVCAGERCQVKAIEEKEDIYCIDRDRCIGCGLCISTCPTDAIKLVHRDQPEARIPPLTEDDWFNERGRVRGVDFSAYK
ncbi:MAG: Ion-translocating oxidoreductase complex subunit B [Syntrophus sp. SKADARSKE-3]|nr:Ion-translocating oxidoreductase complex subunit B [Syntrophus sp. SKADARSKE-3]